MANQGNGGIFSKFQERLRNIRISRSKKNKFEHDNAKFIQDKVKEIRVVVGKSTTPVRISRRAKGIAKEGYVLEKKENKEVSSKEVFSVPKKINNFSKEIHKDSVHPDILDDITKKVENDGLTKVIQNVREKKPKLSNISKGNGYQGHALLISKRFNCHNDVERKESLQQLGSEIMDKIKNQFEDYLDQIDVLMGELFLLEKRQENEVELKKVREIRKKIQDVIEKINGMIDQYNLYKKNYYIDSVVGIDDHQLVDDIIDYRELLDSATDEKRFVREYKALEEFQLLYQHLKEIRENTLSLVDQNENKIQEYEVRDQKYHDIQLGMVQVQDVMKNCNEEMNRQNEYFVQLMSKVGQIHREEYSTYRLRGLNELITGGLRYMGLMMLSPFTGLLPSIGIRTLATRRMIHNAYQHLHMEEVKKVRYEAINYDREIGHKLMDVDYTSILIDDTLKDIEKLRDDFMLQYRSDIPGYEDTLRKLEKIHHTVVRSQNRVELIRTNLKKSKKLNEEKLVRVREMNQN